MIKLLLLLLLLSLLLFKYNTKETWVNISLAANRILTNYNIIDNNTVYPIYPNYNSNKVIESKLSTLRNILIKTKLTINKDKNPIIFNISNQPIINNIINFDNINILTNILFNHINNIGYPYIKLEVNKIFDIDFKETEYQSDINFIIESKYYYYVDKIINDNFTIVNIYVNFIFEKIYNILPEEQFFKKSNQLIKFILYLNKLYLNDNENYGFLYNL